MNYKKLCEEFLTGYGLAVTSNPFVSRDMFKTMATNVDLLLGYLEDLNVENTDYVAIDSYSTRYLDDFIRLMDNYSEFDELAFRVDELGISVSLEFVEHLSSVLYLCGTYLNNQCVFAGLTEEFTSHMNHVYDLHEFDLTKYYWGKVWVSKLTSLILDKVLDGELLQKNLLVSYLDILVDYGSDRYEKLLDCGISDIYLFSCRDMYISYLELSEIISLVMLPYIEVGYE